MLNEIKVLHDHGKQFVPDLRKQPVSALFRGRPVIDRNITAAEIELVASLCPVKAIDEYNGAIDLGRCAFCRECSFALPERIKFLNDYRMAVNRREDLVITPGNDAPLRPDPQTVRKEVKKLFRKALKLRQVSAGGDNSCEMELNAAGNVNFDMGRYGIEFVASPRHADGVVITGPVSANMAEALEMTYNAIPSPKIIILAGTDAISASLWDNSRALNRRFIDDHHIDLWVPGNPAHPLTFINGIMDMLDKK